MILRYLIIMMVCDYSLSKIRTSGSVGDRCTTLGHEPGECRGLRGLSAASLRAGEGLETSAGDGGDIKTNTTTQCGRNLLALNKIVGGQDAALGEWPWIAALGYTTRNNTEGKVEWLCGGALVTDRHIITAAHCVVTSQTKTLSVVRLGDLDLKDGVQDGASPVEVGIDQVVPHPSYTTYRKTNDIAVVKLKKAVKFNDHIQPICLPSSSTLRTGLMDQTLFVAGWGALSFNGPATKVLQTSALTITDDAACRASYRGQRGAVIDSRVLCASGPGRDACEGDSGGPLMLQRDDKYYMIGIVSYGKDCANPRYPGVYTRVSSFVNWLKNHLD